MESQSTRWVLNYTPREGNRNKHRGKNEEFVCQPRPCRDATTGIVWVVAALHARTFQLIMPCIGARGASLSPHNQILSGSNFRIQRLVRVSTLGSQHALVYLYSGSRSVLHLHTIDRDPPESGVKEHQPGHGQSRQTGYQLAQASVLTNRI